ncbi:MAG: HAD hydrolase-like protein [Clostridia bacterium]|nr:HAD hydrolase-like protein [Clostridia bacterium]
MYNAVIFDLDGTLTDSGEGIFNCVRYTLDKMNLPQLDDATLRRFIGPPLAESFMNYCGMDEETAREATRIYRERYVPIGWKENTVYPGIRALLRHLKEQGVYLAVATGKPQNTAQTVLDYFGLSEYMDRIAGPMAGELHANKADLIRRVLPENAKALMVGDTAGDVKGGHGLEAIRISLCSDNGEGTNHLFAPAHHINLLIFCAGRGLPCVADLPFQSIHHDLSAVLPALDVEIHLAEELIGMVDDVLLGYLAHILVDGDMGTGGFVALHTAPEPVKTEAGGSQQQHSPDHGEHGEANTAALAMLFLSHCRRPPSEPGLPWAPGECR